MLRILTLLALLGAAAAQEPGKSVAEILDAHAVALGKAARVRTLRATLQAGAVKDVTASFDLAGRCLREVPVPAGEYPWREYWGPEGVFVEKGFFERFRENQLTTRGGAYLLRALGEPFPLLRYVGDPVAQRGLRVGHAAFKGKRYHVLHTVPDEHGVRAVYLIDPDSHLLENVRFEEKENEPFVNVTFADHLAVDGVVLPRAFYAIYVNYFEDPDQRKLVTRRGVRDERVLAWEIDPDLSATRFEPPGLGAGGGAGFERRVLRTGPDPHDLAAGDLDGDGRPDVAVACEGAVYVHFGGSEDAPIRVPLGRGHHRGLAIDDFDGDGRPELVTTSTVEPHQRFFLVSFDAKRAPQVRHIHGAPHFTHGLAIEDLDYDGLPDLVAAGTAEQDLQIKFSNGAGGVRVTGSRWPLAAQGGNERGYGVAVGDLDGDRLKDIAVADGTRVVIYRGEANLSFQPRLRIPAERDPARPWRPVHVVFADLDGNGLDDLVVAREHPLEDLRDDVIALLNTGEAFKATAAVDAGARVQHVAAGRFDADARLDVVAASFLTGEMVILAGDGAGGLGPPERFVSGRGACRLHVTDLDGDGRDDVCVANRLDDTIALFLNRREIEPRRRPSPVRASACPAPTTAEFRLEGLTNPFEFAGEFRLPRDIQDPSGLVCLGSDAVHAQLLLVSDKEPAFYRAVLDRVRARLLVGPRVPLEGLAGQRLDLEAAAWDSVSGSLFLACEADSTLLRVDIFGRVLGRAETAVPSTGNDGIEGLAFRRLKDGTPLLYVLQERIGTTGRQPGIFVYAVADPFTLELRHADAKLPVLAADQSGATVLGDSLFVVSRFARGIAEVPFDDDLFGKDFRTASFAKLVDELLGLRSPKTPLFGNVEAIAFDGDGDLFLLVDNNRETIGIEELNRGPEGRLLWFRNRGTFEPGERPERVRVRRILFPPEAEEQARGLYRRLKEGADLDVLAEEAELVVEELRVADNIADLQAQERRVADLPVALGRLLFRLRVGEAGLCEHHAEEAPEGWSVVLRTE